MYLLAVLVRPAEGLDDKAFATIQAVGQVLLMAGFEMLRVQRRDGWRCCSQTEETEWVKISREHAGKDSKMVNIPTYQTGIKAELKRKAPNMLNKSY